MLEPRLNQPKSSIIQVTNKAIPGGWEGYSKTPILFDVDNKVILWKYIDETYAKRSYNKLDFFGITKDFEEFLYKILDPSDYSLKYYINLGECQMKCVDSINMIFEINCQNTQTDFFPIYVVNVFNNDTLILSNKMPCSSKVTNSVKHLS